MFIVAYYDIDGILRHAVPPMRTENFAYYSTFLQHHLHPMLSRERQHLVVQDPIILHYNARSHTAAVVTEHPPYSHDMSPCDYDLSTKVKEPQRGIMYNITGELMCIIGR